MTCPNCGTVLSCGCKKRPLPDGRIGCTSCVKNETEDKEIKEE